MSPFEIEQKMQDELREDYFDDSSQEQELLNSPEEYTQELADNHFAPSDGYKH